MTTSLDISRQVNLSGLALEAQDLDLTGNLTVVGSSTPTGGLVLPAGTTTLSPLKFTTGTNLTTATAGTLEYDGTAFYATSVASSRQVLVAEQRIILTSDHDLVDATIASATPMFVATGAATGAVTLAATTNYDFEGLYLIINTGTTSHTWSTLFGGTVGITRINYIIDGATTVAGAATASLASNATAATAKVVTAASTSATETVILRVRGNVTTSTAGTFIPQILASARPGQSGTPAVTAKAGSMFNIWPTGVAANIVVGNWS
jgi:hypothetical protein